MFCGQDSECTKPEFPNCGAYGACMKCTSNEECFNRKKGKCSSGTCVGCTSSSDCSHFKINKVCKSDGVCIQCEQHSDCPSETPFCVNEKCYECLSNSHCTNPSKSKCTNNKCVSCISGSDCSQVTGKPICIPLTKCVQCTKNFNCLNPSASMCDANNQCVACSSNTDCIHIMNRPLCQAGTCVECLLDVDCPYNRPYCDADLCKGNNILIKI